MNLGTRMTGVAGLGANDVLARCGWRDVCLTRDQSLIGDGETVAGRWDRTAHRSERYGEDSETNGVSTHQEWFPLCKALIFGESARLRGPHSHPPRTPAANLRRHHSGIVENVESKDRGSRPPLPTGRLGSRRSARLRQAGRGLVAGVLAGAMLAGPVAWAQPATRFMPAGMIHEVNFHLGERHDEVERIADALYDRVGGDLLWLSAVASPTRTSSLLARLRAAGDDGLAPEAYQPAALAALVDDFHSGARPDEDRRRAIDRTLTVALVLYALDLAAGRLDPERFAWHIRRERPQIVEPLASAILADDIELAHSRLAPPYPEYAALRSRLGHYRSVDSAGGWDRVPDGPKLDVGVPVDGVRLAALERRLLADGDLVDGQAEHGGDGAAPRLGDVAQGTYDERLADAVRRFQRRHGIGADGVVGPRTMRELNTSAHARVEQIEANLERWRWMPRALQRRHLRVNVPAFELSLYDDAGHPSARMAVVVGRRDWPTPVFSDAVRYIVVNPYWNVPPSIAKTELLPKVRRDVTFLEREGYELIDASGQPLELDPNDVARLSHRKHFLRQLPGPNNALGRMKFLFPNRFDVYLHDTPSRSLFGRAERTFSHGCIRVEHPDDLAEFLVRGDPEWSMERVERLMARGGADRWIRISTGVPIYITYFTASVDAVGAPRFHPDIYERDRLLIDALRRTRRPQEKARAEVRVARSRVVEVP